MEKSNTSYPWVIASQYFLFFGAMGIFLPYFNLYCFHIGFNGVQIGILSALRSITTIIFPLLFSAMADRYNLRKPIYIMCTFISTAIWTFFLWTTDFIWMLLISLFYGIFYAPIISFLEALTMDTLGKEKKSYGTVRVWGSMSFILMVVIMGSIIDHFQISIILSIILVVSAVQAINAVQIPYHKSFKQDGRKLEFKFLFRRRIVVFLFSAFLMLVSHGAYYGFFSIHLENIGYSNTYIGITWALASIAEMVAMIKSKAIFKRYSLEFVLVGSFAVAAARWMTLYWVTSPVLIILTQLSHAVTYGTFHMACILYMDRETPDETKNVGQAVNNGVSYGLGLMVGFFLNGYLYERLGSPSLFLISSLVALAGGCLLAGSLVKTPNPK